MAELERISGVIHEIRCLLNAYGDSDESVLFQARDRIVNRSNELRNVYEQIRHLKEAVRADQGGVSDGPDDETDSRSHL